MAYRCNLRCNVSPDGALRKDWEEPEVSLPLSDSSSSSSLTILLVSPIPKGPLSFSNFSFPRFPDLSGLRRLFFFFFFFFFTFLSFDGFLCLRLSPFLSSSEPSFPALAFFFSLDFFFLLSLSSLAGEDPPQSTEPSLSRILSRLLPESSVSSSSDESSGSSPPLSFFIGNRPPSKVFFFLGVPTSCPGSRFLPFFAALSFSGPVSSTSFLSSCSSVSSSVNRFRVPLS